MSLAQTAALLADQTRAAFCMALLDGRAWTAGELARHARVSPSTASEHLTRLIAGGLLAEERQGRHRYVRLANPTAAALIEDLASYSPLTPTPRNLRESVQTSDVEQFGDLGDGFTAGLDVAHRGAGVAPPTFGHDQLKAGVGFAEMAGRRVAQLVQVPAGFVLAGRGVAVQQHPRPVVTEAGPAGVRAQVVGLGTAGRARAALGQKHRPWTRSWAA